MLTQFRCTALLLLLVPASAFAQAPSPPDSCEALLPASLKVALPKQFPGYRLARVSDYPKEAVDQHRKDHQGDPSVGVASTDVDGDGFADFGFLLTDKRRHTLLIAARNASGEAWQISKIDDFGTDGPGGLYVETQQPGAYRDLFDTDSGPSGYTQESGRVRRYQAHHSGFIAGGIESSGAAFFFTGKRWVHLWLLD